MAPIAQPDLCVIGGGTAGHALALAAAALGARCTVVDPRERLGAGQAADLAEALLAAEAFARPRGSAGTPFMLPALRQRLGKALADLAPNHTAERLRTVGVTVIHAAAAFAGPHTLHAGEAVIQARRFVLATGARPALPPWAASIGDDPVLRPATLALLSALPARVAVIAEWPVGFGWAQVLRRLGCAVTLIAVPGAGKPFDPELMRHVIDALRRDGVDLRLDQAVHRGTPIDGGVRLWTDRDDTALDVSHVLIARPLAPALDGLALERAGINCRNGAVAVDHGLRTSNARVFALGDVMGERCPGGAAVPHQVGLVLRAALFRQPVHYRPQRVPITLRTDPALAQVGALAPGPPLDPNRHVLRWPLPETLQGVATGATGLVKIVTTAGSRVLGAGIAGPGAEEGIVPWTLAIAHRIPAGAMAGLPLPAAPLAEASRRAGLNLIAARLSGPWVRRLLQVLRALP